MSKISIGVPCYNEEDNIELMYNAITGEMKKIPEHEYEIIFADNCSSDKSQEIMRNIALIDKHVKVIINQTNFGPSRSGINCYRNASGDAYICIPCDFQEPPEMIPQFIKAWEEGYDIVWGQKKSSKESKIKFVCRKIFYSIIKAMSDGNQIDQITGFGIMDRKVIEILLITQTQDPCYDTRNLACEYGFNIKLIPYVQQARLHGKSSYTISSYYNFAITSLVNTSIKPLRMMSTTGLVVSALCLMIALFYFLYKIMNWNSFDVGVAPLVIGLFFVSGIQLFCIGILGEYISVLIRRVTKKPFIVEKEKINFNNDANDK